MIQIKIPNYAFFFVGKNGDSHLGFPFEKETEFHKWCLENNIGYEIENIQGIIKSDCHVFWKGTCPIDFIRENHSIPA